MSALDVLRASASAGRLVVITGAGSSLGLSQGSAKGWTDLIKSGLAFAETKGKMTGEQASRWRLSLASNDIDELLSAAEFLGRKLDSPRGPLYAQWLEEEFSGLQAKNANLSDTFKKMADAGIPIATLNYDTLLEQATGLPGIDFRDSNRVISWARRDDLSILHLHGQWSAPETCILGIRDYETTIRDDVRGLVQRALSAFETILFIGCGSTFEDPNFSTLIEWIRTHLAGGVRHFALVTDSAVSDKHADPSWHGFVEPVGIGASHEDLPKFLASLFSFDSGKKRPRRKSSRYGAHSPAIESYREFLIRDCGQMTIEGMRADMETAQRKFDLEKLFVPLALSPIPPEIPLNDPSRDEKLRLWRAEHPSRQPVGNVLRKEKRIALLALPGGGKTMLLKRLAVAYADPSRRDRSADKLPSLNIIPILIRCREWKDQIRKPIATLIRQFGAFTGRSDLATLFEAIEPALKSGNVLLLVDGLDEIHDDADRAVFGENLELFLGEFPKTRLIVTSREAGFDLVAPCIARFCSRWTVDGLAEADVRLLCQYWHLLMIGDTPEAAEETAEVADTILQQPALKLLAQNPLLLTMLLVVKHGAGRLPPDRVSLYERAVEVLLNTWNIKGHVALDTKEAVPQLAFVAFEMMKAGQQTVTEEELVNLIDSGRQAVPRIGRYAKDSPGSFLKRVELRSSLLVEAGRVLSGAQTVPFYQFRHLTFQEYLAAVAAADGYYAGRNDTDTLLTPLSGVLTSDEWKEVIPMAAVTAGNQAGPLIAELSKLSVQIRNEYLSEETFDSDQWQLDERLPQPVSRLAQCIAEEAVVPQDQVEDVLQTLAVFSKGCTTPENWSAISRGPYGEELAQYALVMFLSKKWPFGTWLRNTFAVLTALRHPLAFWQSPEGRQIIFGGLSSEKVEDRVAALLTICGIMWLHRGLCVMYQEPDIRKLVDQEVLRLDPNTLEASVWVIGLSRSVSFESNLQFDPIKPAVLDALLEMWPDEDELGSPGMISFAFVAAVGNPRNYWAPKIGEKQRRYLEKVMADGLSDDALSRHRHSDIVLSAVLIAFHANILDDDQLYQELVVLGHRNAPAERLVRQWGLSVTKQVRKVVPAPQRRSPTKRAARRSI